MFRYEEELRIFCEAALGGVVDYWGEGGVEFCEDRVVGEIHQACSDSVW